MPASINTAKQEQSRQSVLILIDARLSSRSSRYSETPEKTDLDRKVCDVVMKRARFQPAKDDEGHPAFGLHEGVANFLLPGKNTGRPERAKLTVSTNELPGGVTSPAYGRVAISVSSSGAISHCATTAGERRRSFQVVEALGPAACENIARDYRPVVARNAAGDPVASVQSVMVRFELRAAP